ncbi:MAG: aminopeptidase P family protein, partial [archaeon]|nr:aminopeptidase P family protein [archaeon]
MKNNNDFLSRIYKLQKNMDEQNIGNLVLRDINSLIYLLGIRIESPFHLIIPSHDVKQNNENESGSIIVPALEYERVKKELQNLPIRVFSYINNAKLNELMNDIQQSYQIPSKIKGLLFDNLTLNEFKDINSKLFNSTEIESQSTNEKFQINNFSKLDSDNIFDVTPIFDKMRQVKDLDEIEKIERAAQISDFAIEKGIEALKEGVKESEIAAIIEYEMAKLGAEDRSFGSIVASGENSWFPHAGVTEKVIHDGEIVTIDIGAIYKGYHSDITRTVLVGDGPYNEKLVEIINVVNESQKAALKVLKPGIK